jgi:hypothetical protein
MALAKSIKGYFAGKETKNALPLPGLDSTQIFPF